jgi:hypothetical protein
MGYGKERGIRKKTIERESLNFNYSLICNPLAGDGGTPVLGTTKTLLSQGATSGFDEFFQGCKASGKDSLDILLCSVRVELNTTSKGLLKRNAISFLLIQGYLSSLYHINSPHTFLAAAHCYRKNFR